MIKTIIWILVIGVSAFGIYYFVSKKEYKPDDFQTVKEENVVTEEQTQSKKMSFSDFVKKEDGSYECSVSSMDDFGSNGKAFINNGEIRGDFTTVAEGMSIDSSVLVKKDFIYIWSDMFPQAAIKVANIKQEPGSVSTQMSGTYVWDTDKVGDYNCSPWTVDESKFVVPSKITFKLIK
ncbi:hypothetical protein IT402_00445 [Candidatus Nomurabacteria bacterium]|nr:hypothetical protein [Candidatus Nomurabacteria bacterium]